MAGPRPLALLAAALLLLAACSGGAPEGASTDPDGDRDGNGTATDPTGGGEPAQPAAPEDDAAEGEDPERDPQQEAEEDEEGDAGPARGERPVHGTWVHLFDDQLKTRAGIEEVVEELAAADATAVIAQVARRHDAYYDSDVLPRTTDPDLEEGLDVLAHLLEVAEPHDLDVHAWFGVAPTWHHVYEDLPAPEGWLPAAHGHRAPEGQRWVTRTVDGEWSDYLDPALPEVRDHVAAVVGEIAARYPVDGIHLDYVRYPSERHGYHPRALDRFQQETGTSAVPAPDDAAWSDWRRDRTTRLVRRAGEAVEDADPDATLSAAVIAWGEGPGGPETPDFTATRAYREALQDWGTWAREGLVDVLMPMVYFREHDAEQAQWFAQWTRFQRAVAQQSDVRVVPGLGAWLNEPENVLRQARAAAEVGDGVLLYSHQQPSAGEDRSVLGRLAEEDWGASPSGG